MDGVPALRFATAARRLGAAARASGLVVPAFRSPPRLRGASRTVRRYPGGAVVSIRLRDRTHAQMVDDMIEGVLVANRVPADSAPRFRRAFLLALGEPDHVDVDLVALEVEERRSERVRGAETGATIGEEQEASAAEPPTLTGQARVAERQTQAA